MPRKSTAKTTANRTAFTQGPDGNHPSAPGLRRARCECGLLLHRDPDEFYGGGFPPHLAPCGLPCRTRGSNAGAVMADPTMRQLAIEWGYHQPGECPVCNAQSFGYNGPLGTGCDPKEPLLQTFAQAVLDLRFCGVTARPARAFARAFSRVLPQNRGRAAVVVRRVERHLARAVRIAEEGSKLADEIQEQIKALPRELVATVKPAGFKGAVSAPPPGAASVADLIDPHYTWRTNPRRVAAR